MGTTTQDKTKQNVHATFVGESKTYFRLLAYAEKADEEQESQIALLFRAIADAERVYATRQLNLVGQILGAIIFTTQKGHAAEDPVVIAKYFIVLLIGPLIPGIHIELCFLSTKAQTKS